MVVDYFERICDAFPLEEYIPPQEDEEAFKAIRENDLLKAQQGISSYIRSRDFSTIEYIHGMKECEMGTFVKGKKVADLCAGSSPFVETAELYDQTEGFAFDIDEEALDANPISPEKKRLLDITGDIPPEYEGVFDLTISTYGQPFWAKTVEQARRSIRNQAFMTAKSGVMINGPAVPTDESIFEKSWEDLPGVNRYILFIDYSILKELVLLEAVGHKLEFRESPDGWGYLNPAWKTYSAFVYGPDFKKAKLPFIPRLDGWMSSY